MFGYMEVSCLRLVVGLDGKLQCPCSVRSGAILTSSNLTHCGSTVEMEDHLCKSQRIYWH